MLNLKNVAALYGGKEVLKGVSIEAEAGVVTTLIGANGAGKTTLLKSISGLVPVAGGEIWFLGERIDGLKPEEIVKKGVVQVPEGRGLFPFMSVRDNLLTGAYLRKDKEGIKEDLEKVYNYFPTLRSMTNRPAKNTSGGEQQMIAFGRGLMSKPRLFLLDEPSIGLAPFLVEEIMKAIKKIAEEQSIGVVLVEQNAFLALNLARKAYVLELGKVVLAGEAKGLIDNPLVKKAYLGM